MPLAAMVQPTPYFDDDTVRRLLPLPELLDGLEQALIALSEGSAVQPLRTVTEIDPPSVPEAERNLLFLKPARLGDVLVTKLITLAPANAARGLPTLLATAVLMDAGTGQTRAVMDATWLTNLRTAGVSAVAARLLTPPDAGVVALLGSGALARTHALALRAVRPIREIRVWGRTAANVRACAEEIGGVACDSAEQAVRGADIVCTLTTSALPVLRGEWLKPGALVNAVGAPRPTWRELDDQAMSNYLLADSRHAAQTEAGDVLLSGAQVDAELGELLAGTRPLPGRRTVVFKALGQAVEDAVAARLVYEAAQREGLVSGPA
ncbi:MAG: ornithine cyclodeaminase family protein [Burkholderiaceae bacterium]